jgi:hypothetical protein
MYRLASLWALVAFLSLPILAFAQDVGGDDAPPNLLGLSDLELWTMVVGAGIPFVTAAINRYGWASDIKLAVYFAVCLVTTAVEVLIRGDIDAGNYLRTLLIILISSQTVYQATKSAIKVVEARTTPGVQVVD